MSYPTAFVTDVKLIGASSWSACNNLRNQAVADGWTNAGIDLNKGVSNSWDISLFYKTSDNVNPETGYITDMIATNGDKGSSFVVNGRTYYKVPTNSGFNGDLNRGADGAYIFLYYTKDRTNLSGNSGTKRVMDKIVVSESASVAVQWSTGGNCDANYKAGGAYVYINMSFYEYHLEMKDHPVFYDELIYNGSPQCLVATAPTGNWGTMYYNVNNGDFSTSLPTATNVGNYIIYYHLDGGTWGKNTSNSVGRVTIAPPVVNPLDLQGVFVQADRKVNLNWSASSIPGDFSAFKWKVYRDNTLIATLAPGTMSYSDTEFTVDGTVNYKVCYVPDFSKYNDPERYVTKDSVTVSVQRKIPVNNFKAESQPDRIVFTWTSDEYTEGWGNQFRIFVDNETEPIYTVIPTNNQTSFRWEHRTTDKHNDRKSGKDGAIHYTEEPLNACQPHNYRIEGVIAENNGYTKFSEVTANNKAIGSGTLFYDFDASKGVYPGTVKLAWHVNLQGNTSAKTYLVDRRRAEKETDPWVNLLRTSSTDEYLFYTDETPLPGVYYEYRVTVQDKCDDGTIKSNETTDIGFAQTTGTVSGRVTYGSTGTSVKGADVVAEITGSSGNASEQFHAMRFTSTSGVVSWNYPSETYAADKFSTGDFSIQLWIRPEAFYDNWMVRFNEPSTPQGATAQTCVALSMLKNGKKIIFCDGTQNCDFNLAYKGGEYQHVTLTRKGSVMTCYLIQYDAKNNPVLTKGTAPVSATLGLGDATQLQITKLVGFVDDFRLWTKCLTEEEVLENYDHLLVGNEKNLETYWTFDEGLKTQYFDYSRDGTVYHEHHGKIDNNAEPSNVTPQHLALKAKTDKDGNYILNGIPFTGEGTTYAIFPRLGVHNFNPTQQLRYIGNNSLVHNGVDFDDVSSFKVTGTVYYENTSIPVQDAYLYVDGLMASKDGEPIMTNAQGKFTVSVPIGDHFVQVKKNGHTFLNDGRFPKDPNETGERYTFEKDESDINFYDQTTVTVVGRVAGGDIEYEKPIGLGLGNNNIGKATLKLELSNPNGYLNYDKESGNIATTDRNFETQYGKAYVPKGKEHIVVQTDSATGEWVAKLPPLRYDVTDVVIDNNEGITKADFSLPVIDATNPNMVYADSVQTEDGGWRKCEYTAIAKMEYKSQSTIELSENADGTFGMKTYKVKDINGNEHEVPLYVVDDAGNPVLDANGKVQYTYGVTDTNPNGYPVYQELSKYKYNLYAYERYVNYDVTPAVTDEVPLAGKTVTIKNQYASTTSVSKQDGSVGEMVNDMLDLDENGKATYHFTVGFPNIQKPYTRGLTITYNNNGTEMPWSGNNNFKVIVLGGLPTGNNFVTKGPDKVLMVLRDPPGSNSQTTWSKGTTFTKTTTTNSQYNNETSVNSTIYCGVETATGAGIGFMVINDLDSKFNIKAGAEYTASRASGHITVETTTTTQDISTSDAMDFVGAVGDVFIGLSKNIIFGACHAVDIKWNDQTNKAELYQDDAVSMGEEFTTSFAYEQNYIKNVLIPNFENLRNKLLKPVASTSGVSRPAKGQEPIYVTTLSTDDPNYGTSNSDTAVWKGQAVPIERVNIETGRYEGPSYTMILPVEYLETHEGVQDMVNYYNNQINKWEAELRKNEEAKVKAITNRNKYLKENRSFSAGVSVTDAVTTENTESDTESTSDAFNIILGLESGFRFSGLGLGAELEEKNGGEFTWEEQTDDVNSATMSYTLLEDGDDDYLSVDIFKAPDNFGPIFVTRGGATSCPFEDEVVTEYYEPGTVISHKTVQIEKPEIEAQTQALTGVPAGGSGNFKVNIRNNSETGEDLWFDLLVTPDSNPDGLAVSMDDTSLNYGTTVLVKAGKTMEKTITVSQTNPDVLEYKNVKIRIASQCQKDNTSTYKEIADSTEFSVFFQPACSDIKLASSHTLVNSDTETPVTLSMSGYNYTMATLKGIRLQYKGEHDADFRTLQEYTKDSLKVKNDPTLLLLPALEGTSKLNYVIDLRTSDFSDKTYVFRAVTVCDQGGVEVNNESEEITIIRDITLPQLIATPSPATGILTSGDDLVLTFNEDIQNGILTIPNNFDVKGVLNESKVVHDVALNVSNGSIAKTEATLDLSGKSFSASMWVNYSANGTLMTHGTKDNNFNVAIVDGKLAVTVAGKTVTSTDPLPMNKWLYLNVSYNAEGAKPTVSAGYAQDATQVTLMNNVETNVYDGNGIITVGGNNLTAKVQELALWNCARSLALAQSQMYTTKSQYTKGLIGYWQLNEGHGSMATDKARNRHIILPSQNSWWINGDNYAIVMSGASTATVNIGSLNTTDNEDYLIETWFMADASKTNVASILNTQKMDLRLNTQNRLELALDASTVEISDKNFRDGEWHHLAVSVLKSTGGSGNIYVDGQLYKQVASSAMPELFGDKLMLGGKRYLSSGVYKYNQMMNGNFDEVRIWKGRRTADVIKNNMYTRVKGDEPGLVAYYPMENTTTEDNLTTTSGSVVDAIVVKEGVTPETLAFYDANGTVLTPNYTKTSTAPLKPVPTMENLKFTFVASERQIKVNLDEEAAKIEGCNISVTVKNVKDLNGNRAEPITWSVYVQQNNLVWQENDLTLTKSIGKKATFTATIENIGSEAETWGLSGLPSWLTVNTMGGTLKPLSSGTLTFTVAESLATGKYEQTIYLTGSNNISEPLTLSLKVKSEEPNWAVNPNDYRYNMGIVGQLQFQGQLSTDEDDIVAAFNESGECVGVARPQYEPAFDGYFTMMTAYGNADGELLTFKAFDASTGKVYPVVENDDVFFENDAKLGKLSAPFVWNASDKIEQELALKEGWNWMSLYVTPDDMSTASVLSGALGFLNIVNGQGGTYEYDTTLGWNGTLETLSNASTYKLRATAAGQTTLIGSPADVANTPVSVKKGGLTWIGYPVTFTLSPADAFAALSPEDDDMVKSQSAFAVYSEANHMWVGTLKAMEPGKGYMYSSNATVDKTFTYPTTAPASSAALSRTYAEPQSLHFTPVAAESYPGNMVVMAKVMKSGLPMAGVEVAAFADNECRAAISSDADGYLFLLVPGDKSIPMELRAWINGEEVLLGEQLGYQTDRKLGSLSKPVTLDITAAVTGVKSVATESQHTGQLYDLQGRKVSVKERVPVRTGVYVRNGEKVVIRNKK